MRAGLGLARVSRIVLEAVTCLSAPGRLTACGQGQKGGMPQGQRAPQQPGCGQPWLLRGSDLAQPCRETRVHKYRRPWTRGTPTFPGDT